jgi:hypothetical protein
MKTNKFRLAQAEQRIVELEEALQGLVDALSLTNRCLCGAEPTLALSGYHDPACLFIRAVNATENES